MPDLLITKLSAAFRCYCMALYDEFIVVLFSLVPIGMNSIKSCRLLEQVYSTRYHTFALFGRKTSLCDRRA